MPEAKIPTDGWAPRVRYSYIAPAPAYWRAIMAVSSTDMYIADTMNNRIEELTLTGKYVAQFSTGLNQPQGIALAPDGTLWVADTMNNNIVHLFRWVVCLSKCDYKAESKTNSTPSQA